MIAIIDSGGANIASVQFALERCGVSAALTADPKVIESANKVILPGVGAANVAMARLRDAGLIDCIRALQQPVLGICLGMQLLYEHSAEANTNLLGVIPGAITQFPSGTGLTVPHMGWNRLLPIDKTNSHPLMRDVAPGAHVYFVHSYLAPLSGETIAGCDYGLGFTAMVASGNFMGCQFHPEKSGPVGTQILNNFLSL